MIHTLKKFAVCLLLGVASVSALADSNKWRIEVSEGANLDGELVFEFSPRGAEPFEVVVPVPDGYSENHVARHIRKVLKAKLDRRQFKVEVDDGEDVLVKRRLGKPRFGLRLVRQTVKSVRINLDRE